MIPHQQLDALNTFYETSENKNMLHSPLYIRGLLFAICASPDIPMPEQWFPWIIKDSGEMRDSSVNELSDILMALLKEQLRVMRDEGTDLPADCRYEYSKDNLSTFLTGLLAGHSLLENCWETAWDSMLQAKVEAADELGQDLKRCLKMFTTFADTDAAIAQASQAGDEHYSEKLNKLSESLGAILKDYVRISGDLVSYLPNQFEVYSQSMSALPKH